MESTNQKLSLDEILQVYEKLKIDFEGLPEYKSFDEYAKELLRNTEEKTGLLHYQLDAHTHKLRDDVNGNVERIDS